MIGPLPEDIAQAEALIRGSMMLRQAIEDYHICRSHGRAHIPLSAARFRWGDHGSTAQRDPNSKSFAITQACAERDRAKRALAEQLRTYRDPCFRCGTRADVGCKHRGGE